MRQPPGPDNALGLVKFIFPNEHHVYLHDTPRSVDMFSKDERAYSHGCIHVQEPAGVEPDLAVLRQRLGEPGLTFDSQGADVWMNQPVEIVEIFAAAPHLRFHAGDAHTVLLDVVAPGPGPRPPQNEVHSL